MRWVTYVPWISMDAMGKRWFVFPDKRMVINPWTMKYDVSRARGFTIFKSSPFIWLGFKPSQPMNVFVAWLRSINLYTHEKAMSLKVWWPCPEKTMLESWIGSGLSMDTDTTPGHPDVKNTSNCKPAHGKLKKTSGGHFPDFHSFRHIQTNPIMYMELLSYS